jgi:hypothetical protein
MSGLFRHRVIRRLRRRRAISVALRWVIMTGADSAASPRSGIDLTGGVRHRIRPGRNVSRHYYLT